jgi:hypothetical protein
MSESISGTTYSELVYDVSVQSITVEQIPDQYTYSQLSYDVQASTTQQPPPQQPPQQPQQQAIQPSVSLVWIIMIGLLLLLLASKRERRE